RSNTESVASARTGGRIFTEVARILRVGRRVAANPSDPSKIAGRRRGRTSAGGSATGGGGGAVDGIEPPLGVVPELEQVILRAPLRAIGATKHYCTATRT